MASFLDDQAGAVQVGKFGQNLDIDTTTDPEDVWSYGGLIPFPSTGAVTTIVSDSTDDDNGGIGANTVIVDGIQSDGYRLMETVTLNGTSAVTLSNQFRHVNRAYAVASGSNKTNVGTIQIKHGATVIGEIPSALGQTMTSGYVLPADWKDGGYLEQLYINIGKNTGNVITEANFKIMPDGESWRTLFPITLNSARDQLQFIKTYYTPLHFAPLTCFRWEVTSVDANNTAAQAGFDLVLHGKSTE